MRTNLPVTNVEVIQIHDDTLIVSKTDLKGKLSYFNDQFVAASGFTDAELIGQPHNIIRHPEMPSEAFEDLWVTLKAGKPWAGAVKNQAQGTGDFYWVLASATPIWEGGQVTRLYVDPLQTARRPTARKPSHVYALLRAKKAPKVHRCRRRNPAAFARGSFRGFHRNAQGAKGWFTLLISVQSTFMVGLLALEAPFWSRLQREFTIGSSVRVGHAGPWPFCFGGIGWCPSKPSAPS